MTLNPRVWFPIAVLGSLVNVVGAAFAAAGAEPTHAGIHAILGVAFGLWAQRLRAGPWHGALESGPESEIAALRDEIGELRLQLEEMQERLDFVERVLSQARELDRLPRREE